MASHAPDIDVLAPDIYFGNFEKICANYRAVSGNLLIPEMRRSRLGVAHMLYSIAKHGAICVSPFGIDSVEPGSDEETDLIDGIKLGKAAALAAKGLARDKSRGFILDQDRPSWSVVLSNFQIDVTLRPGADLGYGAIIEEQAGMILLLGRDYHVGFSGDGNSHAGVPHATQLEFSDEFHVIQHMNGDETMAGSVSGCFPSVPRPRRFSRFRRLLARPGSFEPGYISSVEVITQRVWR